MTEKKIIDRGSFGRVIAQNVKTGSERPMSALPPDDVKHCGIHRWSFPAAIAHFKIIDTDVFTCSSLIFEYIVIKIKTYKFEQNPI